MNATEFLDHFKSKHVRYVGDIFYYDGPLVVLYQDTARDMVYYVMWDGHDKVANFWVFAGMPFMHFLNYYEQQIDNYTMLAGATETYRLTAYDVKGQYEPDVREAVALERADPTGANYYYDGAHHDEEIEEFMRSRLAEYRINKLNALLP